MAKAMKSLLYIFFLVLPFNVFAATTYGEKICNNSGFFCVKVAKGQTWESLFPNSRDRDVVKRLNRMNIQLKSGMTIAVPDDVRKTDLWDISPFPARIQSTGTNHVMIDQSDMAWGAYDKNGHLVKWGPISGGKSYCRDVGRGCTTVKGSFTVIRMKGAGCVSGKYPIGKGGAKMPYCMFFHGGYAMHGSYRVPGYNDSHGCVRMFVDDAKWLNTRFVKPGETSVLVQP